MHLSNKPAVLLIGHGSKQKNFDTAMRRVARRLASTKAYFSVSCAYLEVSSPSIPEGVRHLVAKGAKRVLIVPYFVLSGKHVARDIPREVRLCRRDWKGRAAILLSPYLGYHDKLVELVQLRIREAK